MKISIQSVALFLAIPFILLACNKEEGPPISLTEMRDCHRQITWDSLKTKEALIGEWEWEYIQCAWSPKGPNGYEYEGVTIEFKSDNTLKVKENGQTIQTSKWKVVEGDAGYYALSVNPEVAQLPGRILLCGDRVVFNFSYIELCDNYFRRKK